jgi:hypothetical protein
VTINRVYFYCHLLEVRVQLCMHVLPHLIFQKQSLVVPFHLEFPPELSAALRHQLDITRLAVLEQDAVSVFETPDSAKKWREGTEKCFFNYLLLDPRVTQNLPVRVNAIGMFLSDVDKFINIDGIKPILAS